MPDGAIRHPPARMPRLARPRSPHSRVCGPDSPARPASSLGRSLRAASRGEGGGEGGACGGGRGATSVAPHPHRGRPVAPPPSRHRRAATTGKTAPPPSSTLVSLPYAHPTDGPALSLSRALTAGDHRPRPLRRSRHLPVGPVAAVVMAEAEAAIAAPQQMWTREPRGRLTTCVCVCVWTQCGSSCVVLCCAYSSAAWRVCVCECCQGSEVRESLV